MTDDTNEVVAHDRWYRPYLRWPVFGYLAFALFWVGLAVIDEHPTMLALPWVMAVVWAYLAYLWGYLHRPVYVAELDYADVEHRSAHRSYKAADRQLDYWAADLGIEDLEDETVDVTYQISRLPIQDKWT